MDSHRRLRALCTQLCPAPAAVEKVDSAQGLALRAQTQPPAFTKEQPEELVAFFRREGYAVLVGAYSPEEIQFLNRLWDTSQAERPEVWGIHDDGVVQDIEYHHPLLDYSELDPFVRHPSSYPIVEEILGKGAPRYSEFNFRETPAKRGRGGMGFHFDYTPSNAGTMDQRIKLDHLTEPPDYICTIHYLTDVVDESYPAFCVVPRSYNCVVQHNLPEAQKRLGKEYREQPLFAPAGSCIFYDIALFHTRLDGIGIEDHDTHGRRTIHEYFSRGGWLDSENVGLRKPAHSLTDWNMAPQRLAMSEDPEERRFFSHWNSAMAEWATAGFPELELQPGPTRRPKAV